MLENFWLLTISLFQIFIFLGASEHGSWVDVSKDGNPITLEWYAYNEIDEVIQEQIILSIPIYAKATAPFQLRQIESFRKLPHKEQEKKIEYQNYPPDFTEANCLHFLETSLYAEYLMLLESPAEDFALDQKYFVLAKNNNGDLLGFAHFYLKHEQLENGAELEPIMIDPSAQGFGLARMLIMSIFRLRPDIKRIYLCTNAENLKAQAVYKHLGFKEFSRVKTDDIFWSYSTGIIFEFIQAS